MDEEKITLAIESAIGSGSLSLFRGKVEIDSWIGTNSVSRAEDLLEEISRILSENEIEKDQIDLIAVSNQFGSITGIRIGLSTALGMKRSIGCKISEVSLLSALTALNQHAGKIVSAVSGNNKHIYAQPFDSTRIGSIKELTKPCLIDIDQFFQFVKDECPNEIIANEFLYKEVGIRNQIAKQCVNAGNNLAKLIGVYALQSDLS